MLYYFLLKLHNLNETWVGGDRREQWPYENRSDVEFSTPMQKLVRAAPICDPGLWK